MMKNALLLGTMALVLAPMASHAQSWRKANPNTLYQNQGFGQPGYFAGVDSSGNLQPPSSSVRGGVIAATAPSNQFQAGISTAGAPVFAQPAFGNLSGTATLSQIPTIPASQTSGLLPLGGGALTGALTGTTGAFTGTFSTTGSFYTPGAALNDDATNGDIQLGKIANTTSAPYLNFNGWGSAVNCKLINAALSQLNLYCGSSSTGLTVNSAGAALKGAVSTNGIISSTGDLAGSVAEALHYINGTAIGSGTGGPATAQSGLIIKLYKDNWANTSAPLPAVGEIDPLVIQGRQGGPADGSGTTSDISGVLVNVAGNGQGFISMTEMQSSIINTSTGLPTQSIDIQEGALEGPAASATPGYLGEVINALTGSLTTAIQVQATGSGANWTNILNNVAYGQSYSNFTIGGDGSIKVSSDGTGSTTIKTAVVSGVRTTTNGGGTTLETLSQSGNLAATGSVSGASISSPGPATFGAIASNSGSGTIAAGAGAGTGPTISLSGTSTAMSGTISLTAGATPSASSSIAVITMPAASYPSKPACMISGAGANIGAANIYIGGNLSAGVLTITVADGPTALTAGGAYFWNYWCP